MSGGETVLLESVDAKIAGICDEPVMVASEQTLLCGRRYTLSLGNVPLSPESFFDVLREAAPNPGDDNPDGVIDDWQEPDADTPTAMQRILRHERLLGQDWIDFMLSRETFIDIVEEIPKIEYNENEVRQLTEPKERAEFAAAYVVGGRNLPAILQILERTGLDHDAISMLLTATSKFVTRKPVSVANGLPSIPLPMINIAEKELQQILLGFPPSSTDQIIQSMLPLEIEAIDLNGPPSSREPTVGYADYRYKPDNSFLNRFCLQGVRMPDGSIQAVPFAYSRFPYQRHAWYIPTWHDFSIRTRKNATCMSAVAINPDRRIEPTNDVGLTYAVMSDSLHSAPGRIHVQPKISWYKNDAGVRTFDISVCASWTEAGPVVNSGIFGIILAAAIQPDIRTNWPKTIRDSQVDEEQDMGLAQIPVLVLKLRRQIARSPLIQLAEMTADKVLAQA